MVKFKVPIKDILGKAYYRYELVSSHYDTTPTQTITLTCTVKNIFGNPVSNKEVTLYHQNNIEATSTTNANGIATFTVNNLSNGIHEFWVENSDVTIKIRGWITLSNDGVYNIRTDGETVQMNLTINTTTSFPTTWTAFGGTHIPEGYRPYSSVVIFNRANPNLLCSVKSDGTIERRTLNSTNYSGYGYFFAEWKI